MDVVIEAAVEKLDLKQQIFADLESKVSPGTVLASNTSALSIDAIAASLKHPERLVGIHFFNPVHRMQLVEARSRHKDRRGDSEHRDKIRQANRQAAGPGQ